MKPNLNTFERIVRFLLGAFFLFAAAVLFQHPLARLLSALFGAYSIGEALTSRCPLHLALGVRSMAETIKNESLYVLGLLGIQVAMAYEWLSGGWGKVSEPKFIEGIEKTLGSFASQNPFPWYKNFLLGFATDNATAFAYAVAYGELAAGIALFAAAASYLYFKDEKVKRLALIVSVAALFGGALMNANFYLAAGWTSASTRGSNLVMFWPQLILMYVWLSVLLSKRSVSDRT